MMKYSTFILSLLYSLNLFSQEFVFENISTKDGLSQNDVNCIIQDKQGFMWFGTFDGLNRYDGYDFDVYRFSVEKEKGLNSNLIQSIAEDKYQNIWVGTADRGLNVINYTNQKILNVAIPDSLSNLLEKENIYGIDIINDLVIVLAKETIFFLKITENGYQPLKINDAYFVKTGAYGTKCYYRISTDEFIIGTTNGVKLIQLSNNGKLDVEIKTFNKSANVNQIIPFRKGYLVACANRVYYIDEHFKFDNISYENFHCFLVEDDNHVWAGSNFGLHRLFFESESSAKYITKSTYTKNNTNGGIGSNTVRSIYKDNLNIIWLGTLGGGVTKLHKRGNKFNLYYNNLESNNLRQNKINAFFEDSDSNLWIGTDRDGISYFSSGNYNYNFGSKHISDASKNVNHILNFHELVISDKSYIIASTNYPLNIQIYHTNGEASKDGQLYKTLKRITHPVSVMVSDKKYLWLGTHEGGLYRYNYHTDSLHKFLTYNSINLCSNLIRSLCLDSKNRIWIGTNKGLNLLLPEEQDKYKPTFRAYKYAEKDANSISYNYILPIIESTNHEIWIGTLGGGLNKYIEETNSFIRFTTKDGLPNNNIKGILEDDMNQLWISSNQGVSCLNLSNDQITTFGVSDGLQDYEFREMSFGKRKNGELLFGGNNGFNAFFPEQIKIDSTISELVFTSLQLTSVSGKHNKKFDIAHLSEQIANSNAIKLKYNQNSFTAYFTALHYFAPTKIKYKYRLIGFEENWIHAAYQSRFAKYTNLNPGNYTLELLATNSDGVWADTPLRLNITIGKPWYKNSYAYTLYLLLFITAFVFFNRYSLIRNKIKHELLMERFEKEKVKELTQIKLRFFTNISHELRTPISIIKSYFENIAPNWKTLPEETVNRDFSVINRNIDSLLRLVSQILDFRKLEQDKMKLVPVKLDIIELIESIISSFSIIAINSNIDLSFQNKLSRLELWFDPDKMEKIINNIISNAIKYTNEGGTVTVRLTDLETEVKIEIKDNGIGIPKNIQSSIFERFYQADKIHSKSIESTGIGLSLTKGLVDLHKGRIELISKEGLGSNFILFFKKGNKHFHNMEYQDLTPDKAVHMHKQEPVNEILSKNTLPGSRHKEKLILLVEDNDDLRFFLKDKLQAFFKIDTAENGKIGLEKCMEVLPDIIISDIMMPEMDGYELCNSVKTNELISHIPVILLTAKTSIESELEGFTLGADAYVSKPFNLEVLIARIIAIMNSREKIWKSIGENPFYTPSEVTFTIRDEEFLNKITKIIEERISNTEFSVEQLAEEYAISKVNLNKKIKALTGKTSVQFIRSTRLRRAAKLLKMKHSRVSDVTYDVGYSDLQHFRKHFKNEFSLSPSEYKKKHTGE